MASLLPPSQTVVISPGLAGSTSILRFRRLIRLSMLRSTPAQRDPMSGRTGQPCAPFRGHPAGRRIVHRLIGAGRRGLVCLGQNLGQSARHDAGARSRCQQPFQTCSAVQISRPVQPDLPRRAQTASARYCGHKMPGLIHKRPCRTVSRTQDLAASRNRVPFNAVQTYSGRIF